MAQQQGLNTWQTPGDVQQAAQAAQKEAVDRQKAVDQQRANTASSLAQYIRTVWERSRNAKNPIKEKMLDNLQQFKAQYSPKKLQAIRTLGVSSEAYVPITNIKCRAGEAWLKEVYTPQQADQMPFGADPTPIPDLPEEVKQQIITRLMDTYGNLLMTMEASGMPQDINAMREPMRQVASELKTVYEQEQMQLAKKSAETVENTIHDQFIEGGFYQALDEAIHDLMIFHAAVIKGPVYQRVKSVEIINGGATITEKIIPTWRRRSPLDIYPAANASGINDGALIDLESIKPKDLYELIGLNGFLEDEIRSVLNECEDGGLREWTVADSTRSSLENKDSSAIHDSDTIDMLNFWGSVKGNILIEFGMDETSIDDPDKFYEVSAWLIGTHVIKAMVNPDPFGNKPFSKASWIDVPGAFWGMSLPEVLEPIQASANALTRAIVNNAAIGSGPLVERNIDKIPAGEAKGIHPWKMFDSTDAQMNGAPAYKFYQPPVIVDKILQALQYFMKMADELSGIPAYAHGDVTVGGAGRTASGLQMLTTNANRGIKDVVKNIDKGIIEDAVQRMFNFNLLTGVFPPDLPLDMKIRAKGSVVLAERELQSVRITEFLKNTANPIDMSILGAEGRKFLLEEGAKLHGLDVSRLFPLGAQLQQQMLPMGNPGSQMAGPQQLDAAGNPVSGQQMNQSPKDNGR